MLPADAPTRADALLVVIGASLAVALATAHVTPLPFALAAGVGVAFAGVAMLDGLIVNPPNDG
ncbi:hypothetical protein [Halorarum salinum]|uniref:Uncharacterized protein n=1 Tax=Halorarum salinum TaxID=2743089 RepID=A0A7D5QFM7_9EURY|nr:hypothetical protein [Halobaculum salinum]QLG61482.1 hypothetical protein HUG12_06945 [Halobaculum salinum]